jgi:hypothetical protein
MLGAILGQAQPGPIAAGELQVALTGNQFQREQLADRVNRDVERFRVSEGGSNPGDTTDVRNHPAVQAAIAEFEGEVVAVRPRPPEGESQ